MMQHVVDAARGIAAFGAVAFLASLLVPERYLKSVDLDRFTGAVVGVSAIVIGFAVATIFVS